MLLIWSALCVLNSYSLNSFSGIADTTDFALSRIPMSFYVLRQGFAKLPRVEFAIFLS